MYEIEYMIQCLLASCFKIYSIGRKINQEELSVFIENYFFEDARINISQLTKWCCQVPIITQFFKIIGQEPPRNTEQFKTNASLARLEKDSEFHRLEEDPLMASTLIGTGQKIIETDENLQSVEYKNMGKWIIKLQQKLQKTAEDRKKDDLNQTVLKGVTVELAWVYGFRCIDVVNSFSYYMQ